MSLLFDQKRPSSTSREVHPMGIAQSLFALALRPVLRSVLERDPTYLARAAADAAVLQLTEWFTNNSERLVGALRWSNERAWQALEVALAGDSWWDRLKGLVGRKEDQAFRRQVDKFLSRVAKTHLPADKEEFCKLCREELRLARQAGALTAGELDPAALSNRVGVFATFRDQAGLLAAESKAVAGIADEFRRAKFFNLADLLALPTPDGQTLIVLAVRYFFRRAVENDQQLFQGLAFEKLEGLQQDYQEAFDELNGALEAFGHRLEALLGDVKTVVLDVQEEQRRQGDQAREIYRAVIDLQQRFDLVRHEVRPRDSLSIQGEGERRLVKEVIARYRSLPADQRGRLPALLNAVGKLEVAAGEFEQAQKDFKSVAALVSDAGAKGEAHHNAYRAALERRDWATALAELIGAVKLDGKRYAPFPVRKYHPVRILGAGGFGVAFLCRHKEMQDHVVVKVLTGEDLERDPEEVFTEARVLRSLDNPAIIRLLDCGFTVPAAKSRPYFVMDYFEGATLEECAKGQPLSVADCLAVALCVADGLKAAHAQGVLHRDVKPANVLVRKEGTGWRVKLIDFGLALRRAALQYTGPASRSLKGSSIVGTLDYSAPEQTGRLQGVAVGSPADVYAFARTCCYALFQTPSPLPRHWNSLPRPLTHVLQHCLEELPSRRPATFDRVLEALRKIDSPPPPRPRPQPAPIPVAPAPLSRPEPPPAVALPADEGLATVLPAEQPTLSALPADAEEPPWAVPPTDRPGRPRVTVQIVQDGRLVTSLPPQRVFPYLCEAFEKCGVGRLSVNNAALSISGRTGLSMASWGQSVTGQVVPNPRGSSVLVTSSPVAQLLDRGRGRHEARNILRALADKLLALG